MTSAVIAIVGPTATGKSDWGVALAQRCGGEVLSADSRQVYIGMDIGTGKVLGTPDRSLAFTVACDGRDFDLVPLTSQGIQHWLLDVVEPNYPFTVAHYQALAEAARQRIENAGHVPIMVGGTGLYVRALLDGLVFCDAPADADVRTWPLEKLQDHLRSLDAEADVDWKNPRRLMRAIEIVQHTGQALSVSRQLQPPSFPSLVLGIDMDFERVRQRVQDRLLSRLQQGMVDEVQGLLGAGVAADRLEGFGLEYRFVGRYLAGSIGYSDMVAQLQQAIIQYARRQLTWFRKYGRVEWIGTVQAAEERVDRWLSSGA